MLRGQAEVVVAPFLLHATRSRISVARREQELHRAGRAEKAGKIFSNSEDLEICARELFDLAGRVMNHATRVIG